MGLFIIAACAIVGVGILAGISSSQLGSSSPDKKPKPKTSSESNVPTNDSDSSTFTLIEDAAGASPADKNTNEPLQPKLPAQPEHDTSSPTISKEQGAREGVQQAASLGETSASIKNDHGESQVTESNQAERHTLDKAAAAKDYVEMLPEGRQFTPPEELRNDLMATLGMTAAPSMPAFGTVRFGTPPSRRGSTGRQRSLTLETRTLGDGPEEELSPNHDITSPRPLRPRNALHGYIAPKV